MTNALRTYFLLLSILLFSGYAFLHANARHNPKQHSSAKIFGSPLFDNLDCASRSETHAIECTFPGKKEVFSFYFEKNEDENDRPVFSRTYLPVGNYFATFYTKISRALVGTVFSQITLAKHWFYSSSHRCIVLRVIRI